MLKRTPFKRAERPARVRQALVPLKEPARATMATVLSGPAVPKQQLARSQRILDSARGEDCTIRLPGCPCSPEQTIWSHYRGGAGGKGMGQKASDHAGAYGCTYCDAVYDGQRPRPAGWSADQVALAWHEGHIRSLVLLHSKGLL